MDFPAAFNATNAAGIEFLKTEMGLANTFLNVAETTRRPEQRIQSHHDAQMAYREVAHYLPRLQLTAIEKLDFDQRLAALKGRLMLAGIEP
ncbi:hypothetical protein [Terriglobus albidus]|uniref:hypothetical protein n=1 Tax=Terriglobus albidus TaxID=1592106 RepID=UPI0021E0E082|nr:hypothetical protein [Terriglobus albidus]